MRTGSADARRDGPKEAARRVVNGKAAGCRRRIIRTRRTRIQNESLPDYKQRAFHWAATICDPH